MSRGGPNSERTLILAPLGRDATIAAGLLREAGLSTQICTGLTELVATMALGAACAVIADEAIRTADLQPLSEWISSQPAWSDFPFLVLLARGHGSEINPETARLSRILGNVAFIERPFHPMSLISGVHSALRGRRRQYEARERMERLREINETLESRVEERARALEAAQEQLRQAQKMEALGQLTGGIAHDFNNLLQGITGSLSLIRMRIARGATDKLGGLIEGAMDSANRAGALTHRLLAFARRQPLDPRAVDVNHLIRSMEDLLRRSLGERTALEIELAPDVAMPLCDQNQLENAVLNLCINARDAMPTGGTITISTANVGLTGSAARGTTTCKPGAYVCITVTDTGVGMDRKTLERAFDPFFTTKPLGQGTGLGLSMIHGFARQSEGDVTIESTPGRGTSVRLYLPKARTPAEAGAEPAAGAFDHRRPADTVLVVEDDPIVRAVIVDVLTELSCRTLEAADGPSGVEMLQRSDDIQLLVTDIGLPGLNGRQVADAARARNPALKVLFITGYADAAAAAQGFLQPGMAMLTKPFQMETLAGKIRAMMAAE